MLPERYTKDEAFGVASCNKVVPKGLVQTLDDSIIGDFADANIKKQGKGLSRAEGLLTPHRVTLTGFRQSKQIVSGVYPRWIQYNIWLCRNQSKTTDI